ncbi:hypothetical protein ACLKMH_18880 [Psychromonas sp. KJ10-10]|uniref:hypothetical protein n=1 Tax=Psychromonas sp. KJ10-10 TaxID=3391823 RepID=UPI0039B3DD4F
MTNTQPYSDINLEQLILHWQVDLKSGLFECDEKLIQLLNPEKNCLDLPQLFAYL